MAMGIPGGTVTFLFTDIEGSTKIAQAQPAVWESLRQRHHAILRNAIESQGGHVFQVIGDAFCASFHTPAQAACAAHTAQLALQSEEWGEAPLRVRMGIHSGAAEPDRDGYRGYLTLVGVQRIMSAAHGGQVLLSQAALAMARDALPYGASVRDLGEHRLKDLRQPEHLYQLVIAGLPADFPPLRVSEEHAGNLPLQLTSFVGRAHEIHDICELMGRTRLLMLTGVGGTGKTRLALQAASALQDRFPDGVWLVKLEAVSDATLVPQAIATSLRVQEQPGTSHLELLRQYFEHKHLLLVLDNCEHLLEPCAQVVDVLLRSAPQLQVLATSREALGIAGETVYPLRSLSLPPSPSPSAEAAAQSDAVQLFVDRARSVQPGFRLTDENAPAVSQVCSRLDGIPLALELAAARVRGMSIEDLAARLHDRFRLLTGGSRTALPRQRTLHATIDWSYRLLSPEEAAVLRRVSVFSGGWTMEAAEAICASDGIAFEEVLDLQTRLIDKSLVIADTHVETRYRMLETIRQYAQEKLEEAGEFEAVRGRHLEYFLRLSERAVPEYRRADAGRWLRLMDRERDNLRSAFEYALSSGQAEAALRWTGANWWLWGLLGPWSEIQAMCEAALAMEPGGPVAARAATLHGLGFCLFQQTDYRRARDSFAQSLVLFQEPDDKWWRAYALTSLAESIQTSDLPGSSALFEESVRLAREVNDPWLLAECLKDAGDHATRMGDAAGARRILEESLELVRAAGDRIMGDEVLEELGELAEEAGDYAAARRLFTECLNWAPEFGDSVYRAGAKLDLGRVLQISGEDTDAAALFADALQESLARGKRYGVVAAMASLAVVAQAQGDDGRAARLFEAAEILYGGLMTALYVPPPARVWLEEHKARARARLGEQAFEGERVRARAMTLDEAVAEALA